MRLCTPTACNNSIAPVRNIIINTLVSRNFAEQVKVFRPHRETVFIVILLSPRIGKGVHLSFFGASTLSSKQEERDN